jgi:hypothetical protein
LLQSIWAIPCKPGPTPTELRQSMVTDLVSFNICYRDKCLMNFYVSRFKKKYCFILEIFKFFWGHYHQDIAFFVTFISHQGYIRLAWKFDHEHISSRGTSHKKISSRGWTTDERPNTISGATKLSIFEGEGELKENNSKLFTTRFVLA